MSVSEAGESSNTQKFSFQEKLIEGEKAEQFIATCLSSLGKVHIVRDMMFQRLGIDAFIQSARYGLTSVQFKQCKLAKRTENAFIEVSIHNEADEQTARGWAYKTTANNIAYWAAGTGRIFIIDTLAMKRRLPDWTRLYPLRKGYSEENGRRWSAGGRCVPLKIVEKEVCSDVLIVEENE